jgi:hydroxymethylglutaryl-CoA lyase
MVTSSPFIEIVEVAPRDGLQNEKALLAVADKVELVLRSIAAGARRIEAVSFVNPRAVPQMADAEAVMERLREDGDLRADGVTLIGLVLNRRGLDRALKAAVDEANFVVVASESFNQRNQGVPIAETMAQILQSGEVARAEGLPMSVTIGAAFGCPFEGEVPEAMVVRLAAEAARAGVKEIALADTIGVADPLMVERRIAAVRGAVGDTPIRCHFHNTRNTGIANAYAAWRAGAATLDTSLGGVGGCPFAPAATGNIATEDVAYMFNRMGIKTGLDLERLIASASWLSDKLGKPTPAALGRAGNFPPRADAATKAENAAAA